MSLTSHTIDDHTIIVQTNCLYTDEGQIIIARDLGEECDGYKLVATYDICRRIPCKMLMRSFDKAGVRDADLHSRSPKDWSISPDLKTELWKLAQANKHHVPCAR